MKRYPFITVIIPNYNHAGYLDQRLQSILGQTYQNFEVIVLDDCSSDGSIEVIGKYEQDPHISLILRNEHNSGNTFFQWDKGIRRAKGELIWIAESDDYCEPNLLEELVKAYVRKKNTVIAYSTLRVAFDDNPPSSPNRLLPNQYYSGKSYIRRYLSLGCIMQNASCVLFSKAAALSVNPVYKSMKGAGDYYFWVMIAAQGNVAIVNKQLSIFRRHSGVVTSKRDMDGSNMIAEKEIFDHIKATVHISALRRRYVFAHHTRRVRYAPFESEEVRNRIFSLWDVAGHSGKIDEWLLRIGDAFVNKYNYYV